MTHRRLLTGIALTWIFQDVGTPFLVTVFVGIAGSYYIQQSAHFVLERVSIVFLLAITALTLSTVLSPKMRILAFQKLGWNKALN